MSVNLTRIATNSLNGGHAPLPGSGESAKKEADKYKPITEATVTRRTIPTTDFKPVEADGDPEAAANEAPAVEAPAEKDRHAKWREAQEAKRKARADASAEAAAKRQGLARELLGKGDLAGAAKALGISPPELVTLVNHAAMGMKPEEAAPKPLTPEEQRTADEKSFREEMKAFRAEQESYRNQQAMTSFVEKSIRPVLADKDAYEMIHAWGAEDIETYAYRYMNQHYFDTSEKDAAGKIAKPGEILNAKDVLDAIEANLLNEHVATLERARALKKVSKYFAPVGGAAAEETGAEAPPEDTAGSTSLTSARRARIAAAIADEEAANAPAELGAVQEPPAPPAGNPVQPKIVRPAAADGNLRAPKLVGARMSAAEKIARVRREEEEAARAALLRGARR